MNWSGGGIVDSLSILLGKMSNFLKAPDAIR